MFLVLIRPYIFGSSTLPVWFWKRAARAANNSHVCLYAPTAGNDDDFLETLSHLSSFISLHASSTDSILIGTDSNCSSKSTSRRREAWRTFLESSSLIIHETQLPTFHHNNGTSESAIDYFVSSSSLSLGQLGQLCTLDSPLNLSSHDPIFTSVYIEDTPDNHPSKFSESYSNFKQERIIWEKDMIPQYQTLAGQALTYAMSTWDMPESTPLLISMISSLLVNCAKSVFKTKSCVKVSSTYKSKTLCQAEKKLSTAFKNWKRLGKPSSSTDISRLAYTAARSNLQRLRRREDSYKHIREHNFLMHCDRNNRSEVFKRMKRVRSEATTTVTSVLHTPIDSYYGEDVLEGFAADAEYLGQSNEGLSEFDQKFYKLCKLDNIYIFEFQGDHPIKIPPMNIFQLEQILTTKMKSGKSCDIYHLTVEHLRHCGHVAKLSLLSLVNRILSDIYYLTCPQAKLGLGTAVYKGKNKSLTKSNSYRRITVSPIIGALIDYYIDPVAESIFQQTQSPDQLGFTGGISYLLAAVQRGECQRWAIDKKLTCFGISLDGEAAFPSVERDIQVRELYSAGERGDYLAYSKNTYKNTECHIKLKSKLSRRIVEFKGNRQGHVRASGHFKAYINPLLKTLNSSKLGFYIGPFCVTTVCIADDTYVLTGTPSSLQSALNIVSHYGRRYQVRFNADKTKVVVTGSKVDIDFYKDIHPWQLNGDTVSVVDNNDHLGLIVSGVDEEQKNVDKCIQSCRRSLFSLLGAAYSYKCMLSPLVQVHLWKIYNLPVLLSGLCSLPIRPVNTKAISTFHNKVLRGFLKLSSSSPIPALYFLLGEPPIEALLHINTLITFHNIWANPNTTVHGLVKYILKMCDSTSTTWSNHVQLLCQKYGLTSPLHLL